MTTTLFAGAAALVLVLTWTLRRRTPPVLLRSTDTGAVAALNRAQIALVRSGNPRKDGADPAAAGQPLDPRGQCDGDGAAPAVIPPSSDSRRRAELTARLQRQLSGDTPHRLQAMRTARRWAHPAALPVLRRGLRDVNPTVVLEAARGIERFRGRSRAGDAAGAQVLLPRNVSRTR